MSADGKEQFVTKLNHAWDASNSLVCVGLDPEASRLPELFAEAERPYFDFCRSIIDATANYACAFKPQAAHFAAVGREQELADVCAYVRTQYPDRIVILDAKRGDVGSTAHYYAQEAFERYDADAVTLSPYLGRDSIEPYLAYEDRGIIVLCRTSNPSSDWLQVDNRDQEPVFERVAATVSQWNDGGQFMLVAGATYPRELAKIRSLVGDMPLLVPGIGAQGGDVKSVLQAGLTPAGTGLVISSSRGIIYASTEDNFAEAAGAAAKELQETINKIRKNIRY